ncbi:MAG: pentapeptide repeat-containing protein [Gammaproteobacteria bacterium]|nr:MAG: pentapeptide repeat-containing protein [Gammaproteobacteria bacterium]
MFNKQKGRWYIRRGEHVRGPFPNQLISRYLILGRIDLDTEVSSDQEHWAPVKDFRALVPDVVLNAGTPEGARALMLARIREDERSARESAPEEHDERRVDEDKVMKLHRQLRDDILQDYKSRLVISPRHVAIVLVIALLIMIGLLLNEPEQGDGGADCAAQPGPGVNWSFCNKDGTNLAGLDLSGMHFRSSQLSGAVLSRSRLDQADLSYANLSRAELSQASLRNVSLVGANLRMANLRGANLQGSDLSYAELEGANLEGAVLDNVRLDHAVWLNGMQCLPGSLGACLLSR